MKKILAALALALGFASAAQAALVTVTSQYRVDFATVAVGSTLGQPVGSSFNLSATFDDAGLAGDQVTIAAGSATDSFSLNFGPFGFTAASDNYGGPLLQVQSSPGGYSLAGLWFETLFNIGSGSAAGEYLLSFSGTAFQLTPSGNTSDFVASGGVQVVPLPGVLPLLLAGLAGIGAAARRKQS